MVAVLSLIMPGWKTQLQMFLKLEGKNKHIPDCNLCVVICKKTQVGCGLHGHVFELGAFGSSDEVEKVVENTAEAIEKIAEETEKVMEEVEHDLPEDSKLKEAVLMIEHATEEAKKDAKTAIDLIHKVALHHQVFSFYTTPNFSVSTFISL